MHFSTPPPPSSRRFVSIANLVSVVIYNIELDQGAIERLNGLYAAPGHLDASNPIVAEMNLNDDRICVWSSNDHPTL